MSELGLGCVKTQRRRDGVEWAFHQVSFPVIEISRACSLQFGKLISSSLDFPSFHTARVKSDSPRTTAYGPGCVKTCVSQGRTEFLSQLSSPTEVTSAIGFRIDEIEADVLRAN